MTTVVYILIAILIFGILIAVHELGHFMAAKACHVRVNEFSIGMGPALLTKQKGETLYALRAIPCGGYCAMEGEEDDSNDPRALNRQGFWKKFVIFVAGAAMNFVAGFLILAVLYSSAYAFYTPTIAGFADGCPLENTDGLQTGDTLLSIDGEHVYVYSDVTMLFGMNTDGTFDLKVRRGDGTVTLRDFAMERAVYQGTNGDEYTGFGIFFGTEEATPLSRLSYSWNNTLDFVRLVRLSLKMLVSGEAGLKDMSGPVGIVSTMTQVGESSSSFGEAVENIAYLGALIAVNLAVMNLLPLPALDGGKVLFLVINAVSLKLFKRQVPPKYENYIHFGGLVLLLALMAVVTFGDIWKLFA